jgi:hypothetical protein
MTLEQYLKRFPEAPYISGLYSDNLSNSGIGRVMPEDFSNRVRKGVRDWIAKGNKPWTQPEELKLQLMQNKLGLSTNIDIEIGMVILLQCLILQRKRQDQY